MQTFDDLKLSRPVAKAIAEMGYTEPSPIQAQALPILLSEEETDFIGLAATGTGKTAAFSIPLLERINPTHRGVQAIILCPTRELCLQVAGQVDLLGKYLGVRALPIYGGAGYGDQLFGLKQGVPVVVGTPGRVIDHLERGTLKLGDVRTVVLDEADEMISMGFREAMETILEQVPREQSKTWLFSATMSASVRKIANQFLTDPKQVQVNRTEVLAEGIEQYYYLTMEKNKPEVLCKLIDGAEAFFGVVFCQTKSLVVDLTKYLSERGYRVDNLHGDKSQAAREVTMREFRERKLSILICTDVAARGLDVKDITHVINYSLPRELDTYVHRIGRTARSGKAGLALSLVTPSHRYLLRKIEQITKSQIHEGEIPTRKAIGLKKVTKALDKVMEAKGFPRAIELMDEQWRTALAGMTNEEIAGRFLSMMFPDIFAEERRAPLARTPEAPRPHNGNTRELRTAGPRFSARPGGGPPKFVKKASPGDFPPRRKVTRDESERG